jgi:nicotinate-nucleotide pyrophosphorylase (carboxylating)
VSPAKDSPAPAHPRDGLERDELFWTRPAVVSLLGNLISRALAEDRAEEDITSRALLAGDARRAVATITAGEPGVLCGAPAALAVFRRLEAGSTVRVALPDGAPVAAGETVLEVEGGAIPLLAGERTALNLLAHLSGIATRTSEWVARAGRTAVLDTRKTFPGARLLQRRAVAAGGGRNHRFDLAEFPLVKENHRALFGGGGAGEIAAIVARLRAAAPGRPIEIEVEDETSFRAALAAGADLVLIDNQRPPEIARWLAGARAAGLSPDPSALEASGGITGETIAEYARTGVGRVSIGALTHSVRALDLSLHVKWR